MSAAAAVIENKDRKGDDKNRKGDDKDRNGDDKDRKNRDNNDNDWKEARPRHYRPAYRYASRDEDCFNMIQTGLFDQAKIVNQRFFNEHGKHLRIYCRYPYVRFMVDDKVNARDDVKRMEIHFSRYENEKTLFQKIISTCNYVNEHSIHPLGFHLKCFVDQRNYRVKLDVVPFDERKQRKKNEDEEEEKEEEKKEKEEEEEEEEKGKEEEEKKEEEKKS